MELATPRFSVLCRLCRETYGADSERVHHLLEEPSPEVILAPARREVAAIEQLAKEKEGEDFELMP